MINISKMIRYLLICFKICLIYSLLNEKSIKQLKKRLPNIPWQPFTSKKINYLTNTNFADNPLAESPPTVTSKSPGSATNCIFIS